MQLGGLFIRVVDLNALHAYAIRYIDSSGPRDFLDPGAIAMIEEQLAEERNPAVAQRRRVELDLLRALLW